MTTDFADQLEEKSAAITEGKQPEAAEATAALPAAAVVTAASALTVGAVEIVVSAAKSAAVLVVSDADVEAYWDSTEGEHLAATYLPHSVMKNC
ncbi:hypothetical protein GH714_033518 [Hevea brasiliensis]|uniref:Uncharacterized protein n=1 Tax=Hevea brasiliensis TaxID=3981 RepID=A0A6A6NDE5_HEVBR|nr:hypothetical protein GH714_033518 [Hevea brasiliensis]